MTGASIGTTLALWASSLREVKKRMSWHGWHRHVSLVMLAFAMMAAIQHQANKPTPKKQSRAQRPDIPPHPLVDPGNPPHSSTSRAKTHSTRRCHRMVALAARSSSRSTEISSQNTNHSCNARGPAGSPGARGVLSRAILPLTSREAPRRFTCDGIGPCRPNPQDSSPTTG